MSGIASGRWKRISLLLATAGGLLLGVAHPGVSALEPVSGPVLALVGAALLFLALRESAGGRDAFLTGWLAGVAHFAATLHWMVYPFLVRAESHLWALPFAVILVPAGFGLFWALAFWSARRIARDGFVLAVAFAVAMAAVEWLRGNILTGFPWAMPGHVWIGTQGWILFPAFGTNAATLLTLLAPALAAAGIPSRRGSGRKGLRLAVGVALCGAVAAAALAGAHALAGGDSVPAADPEGRPVLQLVQPNIPQREKWARRHRARNLERLLSLSEPRGENPVDLVIWPESSVLMVLDRERLGEDGQGLPELLVQRAGSGATFLLGALTRSPERRVFNSLLVFNGEDGFSELYDKHHLVPFGEYLPLSGLLSALGLDAFTGGGFQRGPGPATLQPRGVPPFAAAICYEAIFSREMRRAARGASWILQVTNDAWFGPDAGPRQHMALARVLAAELGLPLVRAANTGISGFVDARGRVLESLPIGQTGSLVRMLPEARSGGTAYASWGDGLFFVLFAAGLAVALLDRRLRPVRS